MAFLWDGTGQPITLGDFPGGLCRSSAGAVNSSHWVVGTSDSARGTECFLWRPGVGMVSISELPGSDEFCGAGEINENGWVLGGTLLQPFLWTEETGMILVNDFIEGPNRLRLAYALNNLNQITGSAGPDVFPREDQACVWDFPTGIRLLGRVTDDPTEQAVGLDINDWGWVVAQYTLTSDEYPVYGYFLWDERRGNRIIADLMDPCATRPRDRMTIAAWVNNQGWLLGVDEEFQYAIARPYIPGDLDEDADCDLQDLANLLSNFGRTDANYAAGDLDCDQYVDLEDLAILLSNFGETLP